MEPCFMIAAYLAMMNGACRAWETILYGREVRNWQADWG